MQYVFSIQIFGSGFQAAVSDSWVLSGPFRKSVDYQ